MSIMSDRWIRKMCLEYRMIEPFAEKQVRDGVISYGISSYGYDLRIADEFKIFTNVNTTIVDPKQVDPNSMVDFRGPVAVIPPNSFALGRSIELRRVRGNPPRQRSQQLCREPIPRPGSGGGRAGGPQRVAQRPVFQHAPQRPSQEPGVPHRRDPRRLAVPGEIGRPARGAYDGA